MGIFEFGVKYVNRCDIKDGKLVCDVYDARTQQNLCHIELSPDGGKTARWIDANACKALLKQKAEIDRLASQVGVPKASEKIAQMLPDEE